MLLNENKKRGAAVTHGRGKGRSKQGDCHPWVSEGSCSRGETCSFKDDVAKQGKRNHDRCDLLDQLEKGSGEKNKNVANPIWCRCPFRLCASRLHWQSGEYQIWRGSVPENLPPRPPPKILLKEAWQVLRDEQFQRRSGIGKLIADEDKFKIEAVFQDEDRTRRIRKLAHILTNQSKEQALITDLQMTDTLNPFQRRVSQNHPQPGWCRALRTTCSLYQNAMPVLRSILARCSLGLHMRTMLILPSEKQRLMTKEKFALLPTHHFIIKKGAFRGARQGKPEKH